MGCSAKHTNFFIKTEKIEDGYEYIGDIVVNKEGFYFLWFIPFSSNTLDAAKEKMIEEALLPQAFPDADGVFDFRIVSEESVGFFRWAPNTVIKARVVRKRK